MMARDTLYMESVLKRLKKIWRAFPDMTLGQILATCANYSQIYYLSDEALLKMIEDRYLAEAEIRLRDKKKKEVQEGRKH